MIITKTYHFYAAHRNETLVDDKCSRLHGHQYNLKIALEAGSPDEQSGVTCLFDIIDGTVEHILKGFYDHKTLVHIKDEVLMKALPREWCYYMGQPTSAENVALDLFHSIDNEFMQTVGVEVVLMRIELQETNSSCVVLTRDEVLKMRRMRSCRSE